VLEDQLSAGYPGVQFRAASSDISAAANRRRQPAAVCILIAGITLPVMTLTSALASGLAVLDGGQWRRVLDLNLFPAVRLDQMLLPGMLERGSGVAISITDSALGCGNPVLVARPGFGTTVIRKVLEIVLNWRVRSRERRLLFGLETACFAIDAAARAQRTIGRGRPRAGLPGADARRPGPCLSPSRD
jgi:hypothetical protein